MISTPAIRSRRRRSNVKAVQLGLDERTVAEPMMTSRLERPKEFASKATLSDAEYATARQKIIAEI